MEAIKMVGKRFAEANLREPVLALFPEVDYWHLDQVPLGRKKIDLVCIERSRPDFCVSIELKIRDWRKALWQASVNLQLSHKSYIALWHEHIHCAQRECELLQTYGVGLISVYSDKAEFVIESSDPIRRLSRNIKRDWYKQLIAT
jgi:hypothetical protein